jgi:diaphanous 1
MKETRTARGGPECPTLLHYLARVLLRTDSSLISFTDDLPHLDAAARGKFTFSHLDCRLNVPDLVSVSTVMQSVNGLVSGLSQVKDEIRQLRQLRSQPANDQFTHVMGVMFLPSILKVTPHLCGSLSSRKLAQAWKH